MSSLLIDTCVFEYLDFLFEEEYATPRPDYSFHGGYTHYARASAVMLYSLDIPLVFTNSIFHETRYRIQEFFSTLSTFHETANALYSSSQGYLIEAVIYLHSYHSTVQLISNTFSHCGGVKGPVVIKLDPINTSAPSQARALIISNSFEQNTGVFSGAALALFSSVRST